MGEFWFREPPESGNERVARSRYDGLDEAWAGQGNGQVSAAPRRGHLMQVCSLSQGHGMADGFDV